MTTGTGTGTVNSAPTEIMLIACNPRYEASLFHLALRPSQRETRGETCVTCVAGGPTDLRYKHYHLGNGMKSLFEIAQGHRPGDGRGSRPKAVLGLAALQRQDGVSLIPVSNSVLACWNRVAESMPGAMPWQMTGRRRSRPTSGIHTPSLTPPQNGFLARSTNILHAFASTAGALDLG